MRCSSFLVCSARAGEKHGRQATSGDRALRSLARSWTNLGDQDAFLDTAADEASVPSWPSYSYLGCGHQAAWNPASEREQVSLVSTAFKPQLERTVAKALPSPS